MINFKEIVLTYLEEAAEDNPTDNSNKETVDAAAKELSSFATKWNDAGTNELSNLKDYFFTTFNMDKKWPESSKIFRVAVEYAKRPSAESLVQYAEQFPLLDFLWYIISKETNFDLEKDDLDSSKIKIHVDTFKAACGKANQGTNVNPLFGYVPYTGIAATAQRLLQKKISNQLIGKLSLQNYNGKSIKEALYFLLEARKKARSSVIKQTVPSAIPFIDKILADPQSYAGKVQIPPQLRAIYDRVDGETLIDLAQTMQDFFESEYATAISSQKQLSSKNIKVKTTFMDFISNNLTKESKVPNKFAFINTKSNKLIYQQGNIPANVKGGYTIANIRTINTPQAKTLIKELESFANYISEGEPKNLVGKLQATAAGLKSVESALGIKM